jgi:hypothetical protein
MGKGGATGARLTQQPRTDSQTVDRYFLICLGLKSHADGVGLPRQGTGLELSATLAGGSLEPALQPLAPALLEPLDVSLQLFSQEVVFADPGPVA